MPHYEIYKHIHVEKREAIEVNGNIQSGLAGVAERFISCCFDPQSTQPQAVTVWSAFGSHPFFAPVAPPAMVQSMHSIYSLTVLVSK